MLFALVVMAGVLLLTMVFNNRRQPSRWDGARAGDDAGWVYGGDGGDGVDSGSDCGADAGGCDGGGGGGGGD